MVVKNSISDTQPPYKMVKKPLTIIIAVVGVYPAAA